VASSRTHPYSVGSEDGGSGSGADFHTLLPLGNVHVELFSGHLSNRDDLRTAHEEADVTMVYHMFNIAQSGAQSIKVISDDTDVFVLLMHFFSKQKLCCRLIMEATSSGRASVDIQASVKNCENIASAPFGCTRPYWL